MRNNKLIVLIGIVAVVLFIVMATRNICNAFGNPTFICQSTISFDFFSRPSPVPGSDLVPQFDPNQ